MDGDGKGELVVKWERWFRDYRLEWLTAYRVTEKRTLELAIPQQEGSAVAVRDLDGDGLCDLVVIEDRQLCSESTTTDANGELKFHDECTGKDTPPRCRFARRDRSFGPVESCSPRADAAQWKKDLLSGRPSNASPARSK